MIGSRWLAIALLTVYPWTLQAHDAPQSPDDSLAKRLQSVFAPTIVKPLFTPLIDCPFEVVVMKKQVQYQPYMSILCQTYNAQGLKGFYQGFMAKFAGTFLKNLYTWPAYTFTPYLFQTYYPTLFTTYSGSKLGIATLPIAAIDTFFQTPLERLRILQITNPTQLHWHLLTKEMIHELYRGSLLTFQQSFFSTYIFFLMENRLRTTAQHHANTPNLTWFHYGFIGTSLSLVQTTVTTPFMTIRVKLQSQAIDGSQGLPKNGKEIFMETWKKGGVRHLYGGWWFRLTRSALVYSLDSYFLNSIDNAHHSSR